MLDFGNRKSLKIVVDFPFKWAGRPSDRAVSEGPTFIKEFASRARRPAGHGKRYKNSIEGRLSFSRALTRYKNRVQSVLCHWKGAGHVAKSFCKSGPERILSFSRALTRYKNRVQCVLCHSKAAGHGVRSFCKSGPERIFKTELLAYF